MNGRPAGAEATITRTGRFRWHVSASQRYEHNGYVYTNPYSIDGTYMTRRGARRGARRIVKRLDRAAAWRQEEAAV